MKVIADWIDLVSKSMGRVCARMFIPMVSFAFVVVATRCVAGVRHAERLLRRYRFPVPGRALTRSRPRMPSYTVAIPIGALLAAAAAMLPGVFGTGFVHQRKE